MTDQKRLIELAKSVMDASLFWSGKDEEKNPALKKTRTLAGLVLGGGILPSASLCSGTPDMDMERIIRRVAGGLLNPLRGRRDYGGNQLFKDDKASFDEDDDDYVKPRDFVSTDVRRVDGWLAEVKSQVDTALEKLSEMREDRPDISLGEVMKELDYHLTMIRTYTPGPD